MKSWGEVAACPSSQKVYATRVDEIACSHEHAQSFDCDVGKALFLSRQAPRSGQSVGLRGDTPLAKKRPAEAGRGGTHTPCEVIGVSLPAQASVSCSAGAPSSEPWRRGCGE